MARSGGFVLETARLRIRPWTTDPADVAAAFAMYGDPEVTRYLGDGTRVDASPDETRAFLQRTIERDAAAPKYGLWAVEERATGNAVGSALFRPLPLDPDQPADIEVGYQFRRSAWGQGYATEIAIELIRYGLHDLELERVIAVAYLENGASRRVLTKAGMSEHGVIQIFGTDVAYYVAERAAWTMPALRHAVLPADAG